MDDRMKQRLLGIGKVAARSVGTVAAGILISRAIRDASRTEAQKAFLIRCGAAIRSECVNQLYET